MLSKKDDFLGVEEEEEDTRLGLKKDGPFFHVTMDTVDGSVCLYSPRYEPVQDYWVSQNSIECICNIGLNFSIYQKCIQRRNAGV